MRILVAVLNWGLGHATRCIPLIDALKQKGADVVIASDGEALAFLNQRFPELPAAVLPSYNIRYHSKSMVWNMLRSLPRILKAIEEEKETTERLIEQYDIDAIISDNRYGCYREHFFSALIIHQINIQCPKQLKFTEPLLFKIHQRFIEPFNTCLIPDFSGMQNLSGDLSHKRKLKNMQFIGPLSHLHNSVKSVSHKKYDLMVICSGPEPARTNFENLMLRELSRHDLKSVLVRGTHKKFTGKAPNHIRVFDICSSDEISALMNDSEIIISRSGYSTIMDLAKTGKNAILIPTPGQTEQEYLAKYHHQAKRFFTMSEKNFSLKEALIQSKSFRNNFKLTENDSFSTKLDELLTHIHDGQLF
ncbi:MAG: glycosyltransferase [Bacteroidia bacterium]|nr:glycosyltransferase [Bacteroidia bacterium]